MTVLTAVVDQLHPLMTIFASPARVDSEEKTQVNAHAEMSRLLMNSKKMETIAPKSRACVVSLVLFIQD